MNMQCYSYRRTNAVLWCWVGVLMFSMIFVFVHATCMDCCNAQGGGSCQHAFHQSEGKCCGVVANTPYCCPLYADCERQSGGSAAFMCRKSDQSPASVGNANTTRSSGLSNLWLLFLLFLLCCCCVPVAIAYNQYRKSTHVQNETFPQYVKENVRGYFNPDTGRQSTGYGGGPTPADTTGRTGGESTDTRYPQTELTGADTSGRAAMYESADTSGRADTYGRADTSGRTDTYGRADTSGRMYEQQQPRSEYYGGRYPSQTDVPAPYAEPAKSTY